MWLPRVPDSTVAAVMAGTSRLPKRDDNGRVLKYKGWEIRLASSLAPGGGWIPKVDIVRRRRTTLVHRSVTASNPAIRFQALEDADLYAVALGRIAIDREPRRRTTSANEGPARLPNVDSPAHRDSEVGDPGMIGPTM